MHTALHLDNCSKRNILQLWQCTLHLMMHIIVPMQLYHIESYLNAICILRLTTHSLSSSQVLFWVPPPFDTRSGTRNSPHWPGGNLSSCFFCIHKYPPSTKYVTYCVAILSPKRHFYWCVVHIVRGGWQAFALKKTCVPWGRLRHGGVLRECRGSCLW